MFCYKIKLYFLCVCENILFLIDQYHRVKGSMTICYDAQSVCKISYVTEYIEKTNIQMLCYK